MPTICKICTRSYATADANAARPAQYPTSLIVLASGPPAQNQLNGTEGCHGDVLPIKESRTQARLRALRSSADEQSATGEGEAPWSRDGTDAAAPPSRTPARLPMTWGGGVLTSEVS